MVETLLSLRSRKHNPPLYPFPTSFQTAERMHRIIAICLVFFFFLQVKVVWMNFCLQCEWGFNKPMQYDIGRTPCLLAAGSYFSCNVSKCFCVLFFAECKHCIIIPHWSIFECANAKFNSSLTQLCGVYCQQTCSIEALKHIIRNHKLSKQGIWHVNSNSIPLSLNTFIMRLVFLFSALDLSINILKMYSCNNSLHSCVNGSIKPQWYWKP